MGDGGGAGWQVVEAKAEPDAPAAAPAIDDEVRAYAEWFVWAKQGGAALPTAHAAARAAVTAAAGGADALAAAQGAVKAGSVSAVDQAHQEYVAWFAVANVDLAYDAPKSHAFAQAGLEAVHAGADVAAATAAAEKAAAEFVPAPQAPPASPAPAPEPVAAPLAETLPPTEATAELPAVSAAPAPATVPVLAAMPAPAVASGAPARTREDALAAAISLAHLGFPARAEARLVLPADLELASGLGALPLSAGDGEVWVVSAETAGPPPGVAVVVLPAGLEHAWFVQVAAGRGWPDWFERLPDQARG